MTWEAVSKFEHADDLRISSLRQYLEALGARLELVAVFEDEDSADSYFSRGSEARLSVPRSPVHPSLIFTLAQNDPIVTQDTNVSQ